MLAAPRALPPEVRVAQVASGVNGPGALSLSPPVLSVVDGRPKLKHVPGPKLGDRLDGVQLSAWLLSVTGATLARLHQEQCPVDRRARPEVPPYGPLSFAEYGGLSSGQRTVIGRLHRNAELGERLRAVFAEAGRGSAWCHGDARPDNICIGGGWPQLVDWERAGRGAVELDLGALLGTVISQRLGAAVAREATPTDLRASINAALQICRQDIRSVLSGYRSNPQTFVDDALLSALTGAALLTRAYTRSAIGVYDRGAELMYQIGSTLILDPGHWRALAQPARRQGVRDVAGV